ncbi:MAG TPA: hypothetical protein VLL48_06965, partial [Longimicrobiales bacterium]|nr:hypothetical protein [Longimicrobiales bacterium]
MSHVTDGELHLVLDGALELLSADRAREVREHLEVCGDCGRRLEEERRIRDRSQELLRSTDPGAEPPPPFEEIRARAGRSAGGASSSGSSEMRGTPWIQGLAWAATVVLALGIGWYAGGRPPGAGVGAGPAPARESAETRELGADRLSPAGGAEASDADRLSRAAEAPAPAAPEREAPDPGRMEGAGARLSTAAAPQETPEPADARATDAVPAPATVRTAATPVNPDAASALAREGSLAIPGLPVLAVEWERPGGEGGGAALRRLQALPGGDTLVLRYAAAGDR